MASILGWLDAPLRPGAAATAICITPPNAPPEACDPAPPEDGLHVAVDGRIRWLDATLERLAAERGQAAALAAAWRRHGQRLGDLLGGHFALALVDPVQRCVLLATDRMGTRPLCYARVGAQAFVFGSSAESGPASAIRARVSPQSIYDYVTRSQAL
jgi:asparagine synthase (glutamine-hydrolysing)